MNSYRYNGARDIIFKHLPFNGDLEQSATNAAKIITEELRRRGASTCTLPYDVDIQKKTVDFRSIDCVAFVKIKTDRVDLVIKSFMERPWVVNNRRIDVLKSESSFVQYPMKGQWHQERWSWGDCLCESCCNLVQLENQVAQLRTQLVEQERATRPVQRRRVQWMEATATSEGATQTGTTTKGRIVTMEISEETVLKAKLAQYTVNEAEQREKLSKAKEKIYQLSQKLSKAEEESSRYKSKLDNFRDMLNRSPTGEQQKKKSVKPKSKELNDDQCSDECLNVEQFKELLTVTGSEQELQLHANEEDLE
jgi:hypothetical protein